MKKRTACIVIVLFLGLCFTPILSTSQSEELSDSVLIQTNSGNTLYVGGSGPGNYSRIQDAVDNASAGDTIFVYGKDVPYYENIVIKKENINLIGEDKYRTIVDGSGVGHVIKINANGFTLKGFTILHSGSEDMPYNDAGVSIYYPSKNNSIINNIIVNNQRGILLSGATYTLISKNIISNNVYGVILSGFANFNIVFQNIIDNNGNGIHEYFSYYNTIIQNNITNTLEIGIFCHYTIFSTVTQNNFINNSYHAYFDGRLNDISARNRWIGNYWDTWIRFGPYFIKGKLYIIPWLNVDWLPRYKPYMISIDE